MSYLLDTCVVSELRKSIPQTVQEWFSDKSEGCFFLSVVTLAEIEYGVERLKPSRKKTDLVSWFYGAFQERFQGRILSIDALVAKTWGQMSAKLENRGIVIGVQDLYIASTAIVHGLAIVTRNTKDFSHTGAVVVNPWN